MQQKEIVGNRYFQNLTNYRQYQHLEIWEREQEKENASCCRCNSATWSAQLDKRWGADNLTGWILSKIHIRLQIKVCITRENSGRTYCVYTTSICGSERNEKCHLFKQGTTIRRWSDHWTSELAEKPSYAEDGYQWHSISRTGPFSEKQTLIKTCHVFCYQPFPTQ